MCLALMYNKTLTIKMRRLVVFGTLAMLFLASCKDQFEALRASTDLQGRLKAGMKYYENKDWQKAQLLFEDIIPLVKADTIGERIYFMYAMCHYNQQNLSLANHYFKTFSTTYPSSKYNEEAAYLSAYSSFLQSPNVMLDQKNTSEAIDGFQNFVNLYPTSNRVLDCNKHIDKLRSKLEEKEFNAAFLYYKTGNYLSAVTNFKSLLNEFPDGSNVEKIKYYLLKSEFHYAEQSIESKQNERYKETITLYLAFIDEYPSSNYIKDAEKVYTSCLAKMKNKNIK